MTDEAATLKDAPSPAGQAGRPQGSVVDEIRGASQDVAREARATGDSLRRDNNVARIEHYGSHRHGLIAAGHRSGQREPESKRSRNRKS